MPFLQLQICQQRSANPSFYRHGFCVWGAAGGMNAQREVPKGLMHLAGWESLLCPDFPAVDGVDDTQPALQRALHFINPLPCLGVSDSCSHLPHPHLLLWDLRSPHWTETSILPLGIWQDHVSNLWNTVLPTLGTVHQNYDFSTHRVLPKLLPHSFLSLSPQFTLQLSLQFPLKDRTQFKELEWCFSNLNGVYPKEARRKAMHSNAPQESQSSDNTLSSGSFNFASLADWKPIKCSRASASPWSFSTWDLLQLFKSSFQICNQKFFEDCI